MNHHLGAGWLFIQRLDADGTPTGPIYNVGYDRGLLSAFKLKKYNMEADNSPVPIDVISTGVEKAQVKCDVIEYGIELFAAGLGEPESSVDDDDILSVAGMSVSDKWRALLLKANVAANPGVSVYERMTSGGSYKVDVVEFLRADIGGEELTDEASDEKETVLQLTINALAMPGVSAVAAKKKFKYTLTDARVLATATPSSWPLTLFTAA